MAIKFDTFTTSAAASDVTSVNTQTGDVVLSGDDLLADHTASNYTAANNNIDGHLSGIDTKLGTLTAGLTYKGSFNATAGTPSIANALQGDLYIIDTAGTLYGQTWAVGDHLLINEDMGGSITNSKIDKVDNTDQVTSVNGNTGAVSINLDSVTTEGNSTTNTIVAGVLRTPYLRVGTSALSNYQFPTADGSLYQVIATDGAGGLYWKDDESDVTSVNTQTGAVVLDGADLDSTHTPTNYTQANNTIDGHLSGIDSALAASASPTLDGVTTNGNTTTNAINVGDITTSGDILPDSDNTRTIGDENNRFISTYSDLNGAIRFKAKNNQGGQILKGQAVYISGVSGTVPEVKLAQANSALTMPAFGLAHATANDQADIEIVTFGNLTDYNTTTYSLSANNTVYVSAATAGALTNTAPSGESNLIQNIGRVVRADSSAGIIKVGGAGRSNATPNLDQDKIFVGNASNQSVSTALSAIGLSKFNNDSAFISDITSESLNDLSDVSFTADVSIDNYVLKYDHATTSWGAEAESTAAAASETVAGVIEIATNAEAGAGTATDKALVPSNISSLDLSVMDNTTSGFIADITGESLNDLSDVSYTSGLGIDGYVLTYDHASTSWGAVSAPTPFTVTNTTLNAYTASANEIINHSGSGSGAAVITMPSSAVSGDVVIIRKSSGQGTMITINDPGGSKIQDVQIFPYTGNVMVTYDGTNWVVPRTNYDFQRSTQTAFTLYGYWFGRYVIYADGNSGNTFTVNIQVSATSLLEGARQLILCRGARDLVITSPSSDIVDPTDGNTTDTLVNSVTVPAHGGIVEIWVNGQGQYIISAPLANLSTVATSGAYSDLSGTPTLATVATSGAYSDLSGAPTTVSTFTNDAGYLTDITSENLGDLSDVTITSATSGQVLSYNGSAWVNSASAGGASTLDDLTDVTITAAATGEVLRYNGSAWVDAQLAYSDLSGTPTLATVATTGAYSDLSGTPTLATVATTGAYSDLTGTPTLATVATTGAYSDLTGTPSAPTVTAQNTTATLSTPSSGTLEEVYTVNSASAVTLTLVSAATVGLGFKYQIKRLGAGDVTVDPASTEYIDHSGQTTFSIGAQYDSITLISDGTNWLLI